MSNARRTLQASVFISFVILLIVLLCIIYAQYVAAIVLVSFLMVLVVCFGYFMSVPPPDDKEVVFIPRSKIKIMGYELKEVSYETKL